MRFPANSETVSTAWVPFPALGHGHYASRSRSAVNPCRTTSSCLVALTAAHAPYDKQPQDCHDRQPPRSRVGEDQQDEQQDRNTPHEDGAPDVLARLRWRCLPHIHCSSCSLRSRAFRSARVTSCYAWISARRGRCQRSLAPTAAVARGGTAGIRQPAERAAPPRLRPRMVRRSGASRTFEALSVQRRAAPLARRLDGSHHPQTVGRPLGERHAATKQRCQLACAEWIRRKRGQHCHHVAGPSHLNAVEHLDQPTLSWIPCPATHPLGTTPADVIFAQQQHLDGQVRVRQERRERHKLVEHLHDTSSLRRSADRGDLAAPIDADNSPFGRDWIDDPKSVRIKQRIELAAQGREAARLHLDQLAIHPHQVDDKTTDRYLEAVPWTRQCRFDRCMQRPLAQHADTRHRQQPRSEPGHKVARKYASSSAFRLVLRRIRRRHHRDGEPQWFFRRRGEFAP